MSIEVRNLNKRFGQTVVCDNLNLDIPAGELVALLGPSGCGKTTLLNIVAGFLTADAGDVSIEGVRVNEVPTFQREIGMMFQSYALYPTMSVADNIGFALVS